jgi:RNA recognition motif-containing protein
MMSCGASNPARHRKRKREEMSSKVFVGNLDYNTTETEVQTLFAQAGEVKDVYLPTDRESGRKRGFAFVEFASDEQAAAAIEKFNGYQMGGRTLRVNAAEERPRGAGGGGRSFAGGGGGRGGYGGDRGGYAGGGGGGGYGGDYGGGGGGYGGERFPPSKPKGSRRNIRGKKRSL